MSSSKNRIDDVAFTLVTRLLLDTPHECIEAEWISREKTLRLYIERRDRAPTVVSDCVVVDKLLRDVVELDQAIPGEYVLEVSSPGIDRPLRTLEHFTRFKGNPVRVILANSSRTAKGKQTIQGVLMDVMPNSGEIVVDSGGQTIPVLLENIERAFLKG